MATDIAGQPVDLNATITPPTGTVNVVFQADAPTAPPTSVVRNISAYVPAMTSTAPGAVPTPPNNAAKYLNGAGAWTTPAGGGGSGGNISYYLSPATISPPSFSGWSWAYQVHATYALNANGAMVITGYSSGSTSEFIGTSILNEDFDIIGCFAMNPSLVSGGNQNIFGIALWDSVSGKVVTFELNMAQGSAPQLAIAHLSSFTVFVRRPYALHNYFGTSIPLWLRINCSYGKYTFYVSVDGQSWDQCYQESTTAYMPSPANHAGICFAVKASTPANLVIPHFVINSYVGS